MEHIHLTDTLTIRLKSCSAKTFTFYRGFANPGSRSEGAIFMGCQSAEKLMYCGEEEELLQLIKINNLDIILLEDC